MSSVDDLIEVAKNLLEDPIKHDEGEITAEDRESSSIVAAAMARKILRGTPKENAFHFYLGVDRPLAVSSDRSYFCRPLRRRSTSTVQRDMPVAPLLVQRKKVGIAYSTFISLLQNLFCCFH